MWLPLQSRAASLNRTSESFNNFGSCNNGSCNVVFLHRPGSPRARNPHRGISIAIQPQITYHDEHSSFSTHLGPHQLRSAPFRIHLCDRAAAMDSVTARPPRPFGPMCDRLSRVSRVCYPHHMEEIRQLLPFVAPARSAKCQTAECHKGRTALCSPSKHTGPLTSGLADEWC